MVATESVDFRKGHDGLTAWVKTSFTRTHLRGGLRIPLTQAGPVEADLLGWQRYENWATVSSLIETCKLNSIDPFAYLTGTLTAIVNDHKQSRIEELLPWNYQAS